MNILLTSAEEDSGKLIKLLEEHKLEDAIVHRSLERYVPIEDTEAIESTLDDLDQYENIVYTNKRNAKFFLSYVEDFNRKEEVKHCLNLCSDPNAAEYLEENGIPAIYSGHEKPIKMVEFMLRLRRFGKTLYPSGRHRRENIPGLLAELDIEIKVLEVLDLEGPAEEVLDRYRRETDLNGLTAVIFHSRRSVNRTLAAFKELEYSDKTVISGGREISGKLEEEGISVELQADGSWRSIFEKIKELT